MALPQKKYKVTYANGSVVVYSQSEFMKILPTLSNGDVVEIIEE